MTRFDTNSTRRRPPASGTVLLVGEVEDVTIVIGAYQQMP
jgi:hypothetical protein